jgi:hypothetical protein
MKAEEESAISPSGSSLPPLEDMSYVPRIHADGSQRDPEMQQYQAYQVDQRELNIDQRSIHFQHNIFNPDPSVVGHLAATAATSEVRAEATHAVSAVVTEATSAVAAARAQTSEAVVRAEATQAVAQARESAMDFELRSLRALVESLRAENEDLRNRARTIEAQSPNADPTSSLNGAVIEHRIVEMENFIQTGILPRLTHLEGTFTLLRDLDHQVRENILPRMQGFDESVHQLMDHLEANALHVPHVANSRPEPSSHGNSPVHHAIWDDSDVEGDPEHNQEAGQDVEGKTLRTKDLHHLKLPPIPESAANYRAWRNAVRTALLAFDRSTEGLLGPWLSRAFTARGQSRRS